MQVAHARGVPVVPRGMGTGLAGGSVPSCGGIVLTLVRMNRMLKIDRGNMVGPQVEAGLITAELQRQVEAIGLLK